MFLPSHPTTPHPYKRLVKVHDSKCVHNVFIGLWSLACTQYLNTKYFKYGCVVCLYAYENKRLILHVFFFFVEKKYECFKFVKESYL